MAGCSRPSTANNDDLESIASSLSSLPQSPSRANVAPALGVPINIPEDPSQELPVAPSVSILAGENLEVPKGNVGLDVNEDLIRPYIDLKSVFEYYDQMEVVEEPEVEQPAPDLPAIPAIVEPEVNGGSGRVSQEVVSEEAVKVADVDESPAASAETPEVIDLPGSPVKIDGSPEKMQLTKKPENKKRIAFPKFTPVDVFEEFLSNPEDMSYEELYYRTGKVQQTLVSWQLEWETMDKEINEYEAVQKAESKRTDEESKEIAEKQRIIDDAARETIAEIYKEEVKMTPIDFTEFVMDFQEENPVDPEDTIRHLQNLRNPVFMAVVNKKKNAAKPEAKNLVEVPKAEYKHTKEEIAAEKRKRGRLIDPVKFDDMKTADVYGFEYSPHPRHAGNQPLPAGPRRSKVADKANGSNGVAEPTDTPRTRGLRNKTKRLYEADLSAGADSEEDRPAKRVRKPKVFEDGEEASGRSRSNAYSRTGTPGIRTFASGKRVGRPPSKSKSKLSTSENAKNSESPDPLANGGLNGFSSLPNGAQSRGLSPVKEAQLHNAAESLVSQTVSDLAVAAPPVRKKHAGGRPRKNPLPPPAGPALDNAVAGPSAPPKSRNKGGRPRKVPAAESTIKIEAAPQDMNVLQSTEQADGLQDSVASGNERPKRKRTTTDSDQNQIIVDAPIGVVDPPPKRRRTRQPRGTTEEQERRELSARRTRPPRGFTEEQERREPSTTVAPSIKGRGGSVARKRKAVGLQHISTVELKDETDMDGDIDELNEVKGVVKKRRTTKLKTPQTPHASKARGDSVRPAGAQTARKTSNAVRAAMAEMDKEAEEIAGMGMGMGMGTGIGMGMGVYSAPPVKQASPQRSFFTPPNVPEASTTMRSKSPTKIKTENTNRKPRAPPPPPARVSTRIRRPARLGFDGADDTDYEDEEGIEKQFASEYDHYQALTSPGGGQHLGKRVRKSLVDLSAFSYGTTDSDDVGDDFEEVEDDEIY